MKITTHDSIASQEDVEVNEDKVCTTCGQIFSCESAYKEHQRRKSCGGSTCEVLIESFKGLRCPHSKCSMEFQTFSALQEHQSKEHSLPIETGVKGKALSKSGRDLPFAGKFRDRYMEEILIDSRTSGTNSMVKGTDKMVLSKSRSDDSESTSKDQRMTKKDGMEKQEDSRRIQRQSEEFLEGCQVNLPGKGVKPGRLATIDIKQEIQQRSNDPFRDDHSAYCGTKMSTTPLSVATNLDGRSQRFSTSSSPPIEYAQHLEMFDENDECALQLECCGSEIAMMKQRSMRMEKQCDSLFFMLRDLLQSTCVEEIYRRKYEEELENEKLAQSNLCVMDFESRQIDALRAVAQSESKKAAQRINRKGNRIRLEYSHQEQQSSFMSSDSIKQEVKSADEDQEEDKADEKGYNELKDAILESHSNRRKEQHLSKSIADDDSDILVIADKRAKFEEVEDIMGRRFAHGQSRELKRWKVALVGDHIEQSTINKPNSSYAHISKEDPIVNEEDASLVHPTENRPLEREELIAYISRAILRLRSGQITKSRIRMLSQQWMQVVDDDDIIVAIEQLRADGLLIAIKEEEPRSIKPTAMVYQKKLNLKDAKDIELLLSRYGMDATEIQ